MNGFRTIMGKEFARVFKDKKTHFSMFILPVIIMAGIFLLMFGLISNMKADIDKHISEVYVQDAPQILLILLNRPVISMLHLSVKMLT